MDHERLKRWVDASQSLERFHEMMLHPAQQLGRLDCRLRAESPSFAAWNVERAMAFQEHLMLAYLWVLGGYELVRTVDECFRKTSDASPLASRAKMVKKAFERVRIPLAKFEPSRAHQHTDSSFAWPAYRPESGVAWQVTHGTFVSRAELADELLGLLEAMMVASPGAQDSSAGAP